jgi:hypothetical protein
MVKWNLPDSPGIAFLGHNCDKSTFQVYLVTARTSRNQKGLACPGNYKLQIPNYNATLRSSLAAQHETNSKSKIPNYKTKKGEKKNCL